MSPSSTSTNGKRAGTAADDRSRSGPRHSTHNRAVQLGPVENRDLAAAAGNRPELLQLAGGFGHASTADAACWRRKARRRAQIRAKAAADTAPAADQGRWRLRTYSPLPGQ